ncbi:MAG: undecaprenyl-diphosphate phosphatase [Eubacteriales bacterium]|nr:undecaprenyl-diphosphate phosphatase [Eubacteriales bacterium]
MGVEEILKVILIGIVEGVTEWLPVSSTGHMILLNEWIQLRVSDAFWDMFLVVIQLGAILAVVVIFWKRIFPFSFQKGESFVKKDIMMLWGKILIATTPAALVGIPLEDWMDEHFYNYKAVSVALIVYGIWFLFLERDRERTFPIRKVTDITWKTALGIGLFQILALIPGTSRSGSTIIGGMLLGTSRTAAAQFTFYLAIPVMMGASLLKLLKFGFSFTGPELAVLLLGMVVAFVVSLASIRFLMNYVKHHNFKVFGYYRIVLGLAVLGYFLLA